MNSLVVMALYVEGRSFGIYSERNMLIFLKKLNFAYKVLSR